jgi:CRISPR/Cas system-associated exonuclease Cas4 (RecB family)
MVYKRVFEREYLMLGVKSPTDIEGIYNSYLDELQEKNRKERYEGKESWYHASGAGSCSRKLYFESVEQIKPTGVFDERTKRLLQLGNLIHEDVQKSLTHTRNRDYNRDISIDNTQLKKEIKNKEKDVEFLVEGEVKIEELNVRGFYDVVAKHTDDGKRIYLYDIKTCGAWSWKMKFGRKKTLNPSIHYELQLGTYGYALKQQFGQLDGMFLYYYNKDDSKMRCVEVPLTYISRAYLFWKNINDEHKQGLPQFRTGVSPVQKWQCNYCQFKEHCNPPA